MAIEMPLWMDPNPTTGVAPEYSARQDRGIIARLFTEGVEDVQGGNLAVAQRAAGANMTVEVAAGAAYVAGDDVARQGTYRVVVTSTESVTIGAAPASNSRIDLVVLRVRDATALGGSQHGATLEVVAGAASASPVVPAVPNTATPLAQVLVAAGTTSITTSLITDRRAQAGANTLKVGTQPQPLTQAQRDALSGAELYEGRFIFNTTTGRPEIYSNGGWGALGSRVDVFTASGTWAKPAGARMCQIIVFGGGASGHAASLTNGGNAQALGGASGARAQALLAAGLLPSTVSVTVGAGGAGVTNTNTGSQTPGNPGSASSFGQFVTAGGGGTGTTSTSRGYPGTAIIKTGQNNTVNGVGSTDSGQAGTVWGASAAGGSQGNVSSIGNAGETNLGLGPGGGGGAFASSSVQYSGPGGSALGALGVNFDGSTTPGQNRVQGGGTNISRSGTGVGGDGGDALGVYSGNVTATAGAAPGGGGGGVAASYGGTLTSGAGGRGEVIVVSIF